MVDIHCHILPEVDDGAWDLEAALQMARMAVHCGVRRIITTPHFQGVPETLEQLPYILHQHRLLKRAIQREQLPLELLPGAEVLCMPQTLELARMGQLPTLGSSQYVLTEFYFDASWKFMDSTLESLRAFGYQPVVAHPERYGAIQRDPDRARSWFERGIVLQVNKGSVLGAFGRRAEETAVRLLYRGNVHIIASDAHSPERRTPDLSAVQEWAREHLGREYSRILLSDNPGRITRGQPMCRVHRRDTHSL